MCVYICAWYFGIYAHVLLFDPHSTLWMHFVSASYNRFFFRACVYLCDVVVFSTKATYQNKQTVRFFVLLQEACIFIQVAREFTEIEWKKKRERHHKHFNCNISIDRWVRALCRCHQLGFVFDTNLGFGANAFPREWNNTLEFWIVFRMKLEPNERTIVTTQKKMKWERSF